MLYFPKVRSAQWEHNMYNVQCIMPKWKCCNFMECSVHFSRGPWHNLFVPFLGSGWHWSQWATSKIKIGIVWVIFGSTLNSTVFGVKFGLSEKHKKIEKIFLMVLTNRLIYLVNVKTMRKIFSKYVCFSKGPNFNKTHEKIIATFVISAIMASIWNVFIKFRWHDEKLTLEKTLQICNLNF